jgi:hypothetical protein
VPVKVKIFFFLVTTYVLFWTPYLLFPADSLQSLQAPYTVMHFIQLLPAYGLRDLGISWVLEPTQSCGWGWCIPELTMVGFVVNYMIWFVFLYGVISLACALLNKARAH